VGFDAGPANGLFEAGTTLVTQAFAAPTRSTDTGTIRDGGLFGMKEAIHD
jgi:hypothetical protein